MAHKKRSKKQNAAIHAKGKGISSSHLTAYDVAAKKKVTILKPMTVKLKNGVWAIKGNSSATGNKVYRIVGKKKPTL
jgi:hypothetical protein